MPIRHRFQSSVPDGGDASQVRPSNWNDTHEFTWRTVTAVETLAASDFLVADLAANGTFGMPATITAGQTFALRNSPNSTAGVVVSLNPGASRSVIYGDGQSTPTGDTITLARGETISLVARNATQLELVTPGAVGPAGPAGESDHGALTGLGDDDHAQYFNEARGDARYVRGTVRITVGTTAPSSPAVGDIWIDTN